MRLLAFLPFFFLLPAALELIESLTFTCTYTAVRGRVPRPLVMPVSAQSVPHPLANDSSHSDCLSLHSSVFSLLSP